MLLAVPYSVGAVLVIIGWILTILAVKNISEAVQDRSIYSSAIISVILAIVGTAIFAVVVASAFLGFVGLGAFSTGAPPPVTSGFIGLIAGLIAGLLVVWVFAMISAYFLWKSYKKVSARTNVGLFRTGALVNFIGSILTVVLVGFILIFVAEIIFVIAYFSLPNSPPVASQQAMGAPS